MNHLYLSTFLMTVCLAVGGEEAAPVDASASAALTRSLSVEDAVMLGLQNNRALRIAEMEPIISGAFEQIERGVYDPELFAEVAFSEDSSNETAQSTEQQYSVDNNDAEGKVGIVQRLPTGTEVELSVGQERTASSRAPEQQEARFGLTITQQLLRGMGPAVNLARIRQAQLSTRASVYELYGYTESLVADIERTYWRFMAAEEAIRVFTKSLAVAEQQMQAIESRIEVGSLSQNEAAAASAEIAFRKQALINAESLRNAQRLQLVRLMYPGLPPQLIDGVVVTSRPQVDLDPVQDAEERIQLALASRPEIQQAKLLIERDQLETVVTRNGRLPRLELFINLGKTGYSDSFQGSFHDTDGPSYDASIGIEFNYALGNRAAQGRDQIARTTLDQSEEALANLRDVVRFDVLLALNELDRAQRQITASAETRRFREQTLQAEEDRFDVGTATSLDVAQVQRDYLESQIDEIQVQVDFQLARIQLYLAEGTLLDRRGIVLD